MQKLKIFVLLVFSCVLFSNIAQAKLSTGPNDRQPYGVSLSGSGGLFHLPSALTMKRGMYIGTGFGMHLENGFSMGIPVQINFGITNTWEVFGNIDIPLLNYNDVFSYTPGFSIGTKWNFYEGEDWNVGVYGDFQIAGGSGDFFSRFNGQILILMTYGLTKNLVLTGGFGKTVGYGTDWANWDVGLGLNYIFFKNANTQISWLNEFTNFSYQFGNDGMLFGNASHQGLFSTGIRAVFVDLFILNTAFLDLFNFKETSFYIGFGFLVKY